MSVVMEGKQTYSGCIPPFNQDICQTAKHQSTMSGRRLVCFVGSSDVVPGVSDSAPETVHQIASDMNKSKRKLSPNVGIII